MIKTLKNLFKQDKEKFVVPKSLQAEDDDKTKAPGAEIASGAFVLI